MRAVEFVLQIFSAASRDRYIQELQAMAEDLFAASPILPTPSV